MKEETANENFRQHPIGYRTRIGLLIVWLTTAASLSHGTFASEPTLPDLTPRLPWSNERLTGSPDPPLPLRTERVFPNLTFKQPITLRDLPGRNRRMVLQRSGEILTFLKQDDPTETHLALDLGELAKTTANERIAAARDLILDPNFEANGFLYVVWAILPHEVEGGSRVSRFELQHAEPPTIDPASRLDVITYPSGDHIGSSLRFGPDRYLYITTGDGARPFPPDRLKTAQNVGDLRGGVLRIDVRGATADQPYTIPDDNPFLKIEGARSEVYAYGLRNGFRSAFRPATGSFWVADVGWEQCEMVHRIVKGGNHGWSLYEGPHPVEPNQRPGPSMTGGESQRILPAIVMPRNEAQSITGGVFIPESSSLHNGSRSLAGDYLFGCFMNGVVWAANVNDESKPIVRKVAETGMKMLDFTTTQLDVTPEGETEVLMVDFGAGQIVRLVNQASDSDRTASESFATRLSETGLYEELGSLTPAAGVIAYQPSATMSRDGAEGHRLIAIPSMEKIKPHRVPRQTFYPVGTVLANTLTRRVVTASGNLSTRKIETQLLIFDGLNWDPYTYRWNDQQTDATLVPASGDQRRLTVPDLRLGRRVTTHTFASRSQCQVCHHVANPGGYSLTPSNLHGQPAQLRNQLHPQTAVSWQQLVDAGYAKSPSAKPVLTAPHVIMLDPQDAEATLEVRARSYLAMNCRHCHMPVGGGRVALNLNRDVSTENLNAINEPIAQGDMNLADARVIVPGHPERSVLLYRMATAGPGRMPKIGYHDPDLSGARLIWDWIASMPKQDVEVTSGPSTSSEQTPSQPKPNVTKALLTWRETIDLPRDAAIQRVEKILASENNPLVDGLFEPWMDPSKRTTRVGDQPDVAKLLALSGDANRGRDWFARGAAAQCRSCHRVRGNEALVGPSLDGIATKRTRAELLDQLLHPSRVIEPAWKTHAVLTVDGELFVGLRIKTTSDSWTLRLANGADVTIAAEDIETAKESDQSLMPTGLLSPMSPQEVADLLSYLQTLR